MTVARLPHPSMRTMLNKVPQVILAFWVIKILCTTVGETFADYLNSTLQMGLTNTTYVMGAALIVSLVVQFRVRRYVPAIYWLAVVLISVVGTLITDNLVTNFHVTLVTTTVVFSICLAASFVAWYRSEKTLSIHSIVTTRRESFYWLTVLFTFCLGTASGDLVAEHFQIGYWKSALVFGALIGLVFLMYRLGKLGPISAFWIAYIFTRPLGASIGDYLSQPTKADPAALAAGDIVKADVGLGLGTTATSIIFLLLILGVVIYLTITKSDEIPLSHLDAVPCPHCDEVGKVRPVAVTEHGHQECVCPNGHRFIWSVRNQEVISAASPT